MTTQTRHPYVSVDDRRAKGEQAAPKDGLPEAKAFGLRDLRCLPRASRLL